MALLGCPFCRDLVPDDEGDSCAVCGVKLVPIDRLPLSYEAREAVAAQIAATPPEYRKLPWWYFRRGRGALLLLALLGIAFFVAPWIVMTKPADSVFSGLELARHRAPWFWGGAVGWFVMVPLVLTRRTIVQMRGVRVIVTTFAALTTIEALFLVLRAPIGTRYVPLEYAWGWGLYASAATSTVAMAFGATLGGRLDDLEPSPRPTSGAPDGSDRETSAGRTLH